MPSLALPRLEQNPLPPFKPFCAQIVPLRVGFSNQCPLLFLAPALDLFLAGDRIFDVLEFFVVDQFLGFVLLREAWQRAAFVLVHAPIDVVGHADIGDTGWVGHDVDVEGRLVWFGAHWVDLSID